MPFKSRKLSNHCRQRALRACTTSAEAKAQSKQSMLSTCELLDAYATSLDPEATSVKIRFANANKAAEDVDKKMFSKLTLSIWETLEEQFSRIYAARAKLSSFAQVSILENNAKDEPVQPYAPAESLRERQATQDLQNGLNVLMHVDDVNVPNTVSMGYDHLVGEALLTAFRSWFLHFRDSSVMSKFLRPRAWISLGSIQHHDLRIFYISQVSP